MEQELEQTKEDVNQLRGSISNDVNELRNSVSRIESMMAELTSKVLQNNTAVNEVMKLLQMNGNLNEGTTEPVGTANANGSQATLDSMPPMNVNGTRNSMGCPQFGPFTEMQAGSSSVPTKNTIIEFPKFDGTDYNGWAFRCKQFFEVDETPSEQRIRLISIHLEGKALQWHQTFMRGKKSGEVKWRDYMENMARRFRDVLKVDPMSELKKLKQEDTVVEYQERFEELLSEVDITEAVAISCFLGGLKSEIEAPVRMFKPSSLSNTMYLARLQEVSLQASQDSNQTFTKTTFMTQNSSSSPINSRNSPSSSSANLSNTSVKTQPNIAQLINQNTNSTNTNPLKTYTNQNNPVKQLTKKEMDDRRKKGLCHWCPERYTPDHKCKSSQLFMIVVTEKEGESYQEENQDSAVEEL